jgi:predicted SAM-dependent methyltransferase
MKLHLGSGSVRHDGWLNVDLDAPSADLHLDLTEPLPFDDGSVEFIVNEHFIEHVTRDEALALLKECHRVLCPDGVLRLSTPNLKFLTVCYLSRRIDEWDDLWMPANPCRMMNEGMRSWGHQFMYDADELTAILTEAGFAHITFVAWCESAIDELVGLESRPFHGELIVEAAKGDGGGPQRGAPAAPSSDEPWQSAVENALVDQVERLERTIADQTARIRALEAEVSKQTLSWRRMLGNAAQKLRRW